MNSKNETRLLRVWFQLLSEMDDVRIDCPRVGIVLVTPHRVQKPIAPERFAGDVPYQVIIVILDSGDRITARVDGDRVAIDDRVVEIDSRDGIPVFRKS